jgi:hypothetical protein
MITICTELVRRPVHAPQGIDQHHGGADHDTRAHAHGAAGDRAEYEPDHDDLGGEPAQVRHHDREARQQLGGRVVAGPVVIADGEEIHAVELRGEEETDQDEAQAGAERVGDDPAQPLLQEGRGDAQHGLGAEPRRAHHRRYHVKRQRAAREDEITRVVDPEGGDNAHGDG